MKRKTTTSAVVLLIALATVFALYISRGPSQTTKSPPSAEQQRDTAALKNQIGVLEERMNTLEERLAEPRSQSVKRALH
jgi:hypothetical protein